MKEIQLTQGKVAIVDDEDYAELSKNKWHFNSEGYAQRSVRSGGVKMVIKMHRVIIGAPAGKDVDHINCDKLDNRRVNLRIATRSENMRNRGANANNASGFKGVSYSKLRGKWQSTITLDGRTKHLGFFATPADAARAYNEAVSKHYGEFAKLNELN